VLNVAETSFRDIVAGLFENVPVLLIVCGILLFVLGCFGGISYKDILVISDTFGRVGLTVGGALVFTVGVWGLGQAKVINASKYGIQITSVKDNDLLDKRVTLRGELKKTLPANYNLWLIRIYPHDAAYYPMRLATVNPSNKSWEAIDCDLGGEPSDVRIIAVCLVGPSTKVFFDYFKDAEAVHGRALGAMRKANVTGGEYLPLIPNDRKPTDLIECHRLKVIRK
jgi:hypothetical protein